jgi:nitroreductase
MTNKDLYSDILQYRHACKTFCKKKIISNEDIDFILNSAILTPTSFGMEGYKILVITNSDLKEKLKPFCWNQAQITTCSHLLILLASIKDLYPTSDYVKKKFARRRLTKEQEEAYLQKYTEFIKQNANDDEKMFSWSAKQTYLIAMNIILAASSLKIDSCPIEGFEREKVEQILDINTSDYRVSLILPLGYRIYPQTEHLRDNIEEKVQFIN